MAENPDVEAARAADPHDPAWAGRTAQPPAGTAVNELGELLRLAQTASPQAAQVLAEVRRQQAAGGYDRGGLTAPGERPEPLPSVGRDVHYVSYGTPGGECRAAKITEVGAWLTTDSTVHAADPQPGDVRTLFQRWDPQACTLAVFKPGGLYLNPQRPCPHDEGGTSDTPGAPDRRSYAGGTWHWPERVGP